MSHKDIATLAAHLQALLGKVPSSQLHAGQVAGDKPGILAGDMPVCRMRETAEGALYATLIVEGINALPQLLNALETPAQAAGAAPADEDSPLRQQIEGKISETLQMLPGFKAATTGVWAKLLYAAVEPWLAGGREVLVVESAPVPQRQQEARGADGEKQARLDAVTEFCNYMLGQGEGESMPNEHALEQLVTDWDKAHNGALPHDQHQSGNAQ